MVGIIIETPDEAKSVAKNILKASIPPKKGLCSWGGETRQQKKRLILRDIKDEKVVPKSHIMEKKKVNDKFKK